MFTEAPCNENCLKRQIDNYHNQCGINNNTDVKAVSTSQIPDARDTTDAQRMAEYQSTLKQIQERKQELIAYRFAYTVTR